MTSIRNKLDGPTSALRVSISPSGAHRGEPPLALIIGTRQCHLLEEKQRDDGDSPKAPWLWQMGWPHSLEPWDPEFLIFQCGALFRSHRAHQSPRFCSMQKVQLSGRPEKRLLPSSSLLLQIPGENRRGFWQVLAQVRSKTVQLGDL